MNIKLLYFTLMISFTVVYAQQLEEVTLSNNNAIIYGEAFWIDKNNDNQLEFFVTGSNNNYDEFSSLFRFENNEFIIDSSSSFIRLSQASADKADFNNDGLMDIIITGYDGTADVTKLYLNDGTGVFVEQPVNFVAATSGKIRVADLNNDDLPEVIITGFIGDAYGAHLYYQESDGTFTEDINIQLMENYFGDITYIDFNNDDFLDVIITGFDTNYTPNTKVYLNNNGVLEPFSSHNIDPYYFSNTDVYDIDNDGDTDLLISGSNSSYQGETSLYLNDGSGSFTKQSNFNLTPVYFGDLSFVDFNNDTYQDVFITGQDVDGTYVSELYMNDGAGNFTINQAVSDQVINLAISTLDWGDFDNDDDLDLIISGFDDSGDEQIRMYKNEQEVASVVDKTANTISFYPNPTKGKLKINNPFGLEFKSIKVFNNVGQKVREFTEEMIDLESLSNGIYRIEITTNNNMMVRSQVIKE